MKKKSIMRQPWALLLLTMAATATGTTLHAMAAGPQQSVQREASTIKGVVVNEEGEPIIGATVRVKGTSTGAITDINGRFELKRTATGAVIEVSYIGYNTASVKATTGNMAVTLHSAATKLNDVVVVGDNMYDFYNILILSNL